MFPALNPPWNGRKAEVTLLWGLSGIVPRVHLRGMGGYKKLGNLMHARPQRVQGIRKVQTAGDFSWKLALKINDKREKGLFSQVLHAVNCMWREGGWVTVCILRIHLKMIFPCVVSRFFWENTLNVLLKCLNSVSCSVPF